MNTNLRQETAKIYQFPVKRAARGLDRRSEATAIADQRSQPLPAVGGAWYHEAAVQDELRSSKP